METHSDLPPATQPAVQFANSAQLNHPPYDEMIMAAIVARNEKDGSSRQAIARYIESEYKNLPETHDFLLTQQLRRMKNQGQLVMNKHSYMIAGSGQSEANVSQVSDVPKRRPGRPPKSQLNGGGSAGSVGLSGSGGVSASVGVSVPVVSDVVLPATTVVPFDPIGAVPTVVPIGEVSDLPPVKRRPGRPPKLHAIVTEAAPIMASQPISAARKPGRPTVVNNGVIGVGGGGSILGKRRRGRPVQKSSLVSALVGNGGGVKRGRGRPPRAVGSGIGQRPRGRPRKGVVSRVGTLGRPMGRPPKNVGANGGVVAAFVPVEGLGGTGRPSKMAVRRNPRKLSGKPLGRPKKFGVNGGGAAFVPVEGVGGTGRPSKMAVRRDPRKLSGKPLGRPKKSGVNGGGAGGGFAAAFMPVEGVGGTGRPSKMAVRRNPRKLSGKPLGRPKKDASVVANQTSNNQKYLTAYQDLKTRVEHFQSRVKQAVDIVKPYLNDEAAAMARLQEIETLALMDMGAPASGPIAGLSAPRTGTTALAPNESVPVSEPAASMSAQGQEPPNRN